MTGKEITGLAMLLIPFFAAFVALGGWEMLLVVGAAVLACAWVAVAVGLLDGSL
jgi:hypothetical protein